VATAGISRQSAQARPSGSMVEVVERSDELALRPRRDVGPG
jgi:hypothetical protein